MKWMFFLKMSNIFGLHNSPCHTKNVIRIEFWTFSHVMEDKKIKKAYRLDIDMQDVMLWPPCLIYLNSYLVCTWTDRACCHTYNCTQGYTWIVHQIPKHIRIDRADSVNSHLSLASTVLLLMVQKMASQ